MESELKLAPYEQRLYDALVLIGQHSEKLKAWATAPPDGTPMPRGFNESRKLLMQHISEAARQTDIPASTLRRWCAEGLILSEKRGRDWFVDIDDAVFRRDDVVTRRQKSQRERREREAGYV